MLTLINTIPTYSFADNPIWIILESDEYTGSAPPFEPNEPNQRVILLVISVNPETSEQITSTLSLAISPFTKRAFANIAPLINLKITPPDPDTIINPNIQLYQDYNAWATFIIAGFEQSGLPPETNETPSLEIGGDPLYAIKGGLPLDAVNTINPITTATYGKMLHLLLGNIYQDTLPITNIDDLVIRPATTEMPSWMYIFFTDPTNYNIIINIGYSDGSTETEGYFNLSAELGINYIPVGWNQLNLDNLISPPAGAKPEYYSVTVVESGDGDDLGFTMLFQLHECQPFTRYILMETGLGGLETIPLFGKHAYGVESSRETTRMTTTIDTTSESGTYANFNRQTNRIITAQTGYYTKNYIDLLSQLLCGELWEIDIKGERFLKIAADQQTFRELYKEDDDLYALEFKYRQGWDDPHSIKI